MQYSRKVLLAAAGGAVAVVLLIVIISVVVTQQRQPSTTTSPSLDTLLPGHLDPAQCPPEYGNPRPILLISLDGYRADYMGRGLSPMISRLAEKGVRTPNMFSVFPTKTFPNHYSIVTGLYPESHGIVDNTFWDPDYRAVFSIGGAPAKNGSWWSGEPIWNTLAKQGKKSATFFWPGSEAGVGGRYPDHWYLYNGSIPYEQRVEQVLEWVQLPPAERPAWISLYFDEPDRQGHNTGPDDPQVNEQISRVDHQVQSVVEGLSSRELLHCVNLLIVSDHGMAESTPEKVVDLRDIVPNITDLAHVFSGAFSRINPKVPDQVTAEQLAEELSCVREGFRAFLRPDLPRRYHYASNNRIEPLVLDMDPGYYIRDLRPGRGKRPPKRGQHGYDYYNSEMNALFVGYGPDLVQGVEVAPFQNLELYNLMCDLMGVTPAPNNGSRGALNRILASPPQITPPTQSQVTFPTLTLPTDEVKTEDVTSGCTGDQEGNKDWSGILGLTEEQRVTKEKEHLPWGAPIPTMNHTSTAHALLHHYTHITGYSEAERTPLWTSFSLVPQASSQSSPQAPSSSSSWLSDPRLGSLNTAACANTNNLPANSTLRPLFPSAFSKTGSASESEVTRLISNGCVMGEAGVARWRQLTEDLLVRWLAEEGPLNILLGPVFDHDHDGHADLISNSGSAMIPSDNFAVVTRCQHRVRAIQQCPPELLYSLAFLYPLPHYQWTCAEAEQYAKMYSARVRDVELVTGLTIFPSLQEDTRLAHNTAIHPQLWQR